MKIGIIGTGTVGCACAKAAVNRGSARNIVLVNRRAGEGGRGSIVECDVTQAARSLVKRAGAASV